MQYRPLNEDGKAIAKNLTLLLQSEGFTIIHASSKNEAENDPTSPEIILTVRGTGYRLGDVYAQNNEKLAIFRRRQVGLIYQLHNLIPTLNVVENITLPILMDKRKVNEDRLNELLEMIRLQDRKDNLPNQH